MKAKITVVQDSKTSKFGWSFVSNGHTFSEGGYVSEDAANKAGEAALDSLQENDDKAKKLVDKLLE